MIIIYIIIGCAMTSIIIKIIKAIEKPNNSNIDSSTNNTSFTYKRWNELILWKSCRKTNIDNWTNSNTITTNNTYLLLTQSKNTIKVFF